MPTDPGGSPDSSDVDGDLPPALPLPPRYTQPVVEDETLPDAVTLRAGHDLPDEGIARGRTAFPGIPGYTIQSVLGEGGMGTVYRAIDLKLGREVALKLVVAGRADRESRQRFEVEAKALAQVTHHSIVRIYETGLVGDQPWLAMELVDGRSLDAVAKGQPLEPRRAADLVRQLAAALETCHARGIIHRDIKPSNVLLTENGLVKLTDFGIARMLGDQAARLTRTGALLGTPAYMAPEQASGVVRSIGPTTDIYGCGALLYELLTGRPPFNSHDPFLIMLRVLSDEPVAPRQIQPRIPADLETITLKCLAKKPAHRYASSRALADDLNRFLRGEPVLARRTPWYRRVILWTRRHPAVTALIVATILCVAGVIGGLALHSRTLQTELDRTTRLVSHGRELSRWLLRDFSHSLDSDAGVTVLRSQLAARTEAYLSAMRQEAGADTALRFSLAESLVQLAALQGQPEAGSLGLGDNALASLAAADEVLGVADPSESAAQRGLRATIRLRRAAILIEQRKAAEAASELKLARAGFDAVRDGLGSDQRFELELDLLILELGVAAREADAAAAQAVDARLEACSQQYLEGEERPAAILAVRSRVWHVRAAWLDAEGRLVEVAEPLGTELARLELELAGQTQDRIVRLQLAGLRKLLADALLVDGQFEEAGKLFRRNRAEWQLLLDRDPGNQGAEFNLANAWSSIAGVCLQSGELDEANVAVERAARHFASCARRSGQEPELMPEWVDLDALRARLKLNAGDPEASRDAAQRLVSGLRRIGDTSPSGGDRLGEALFLLGLAEVAACQELLDGDEMPSSKSVNKACDQAIQRLKDVERHFEQMEAIGPRSERATDLLDRSRQMQELVEESRREKLESPENRAD